MYGNIFIKHMQLNMLSIFVKEEKNQKQERKRELDLQKKRKILRVFLSNVE